MTQPFGSEDHRVEIQLPQIFRSVFLGSLAPFRKSYATVIRAAGVGWQIAARMGRANLEPREPIERPVENQMRQKNRGLERIADHVGQSPAALQTLVQLRNSLVHH